MLDSLVTLLKQEGSDHYGSALSFEETVKDIDAVMIELNDPTLHLEYFKKCAELNLPIYLDKPLADTYKNGKEIYDIAIKKNLKVCSMSSLRFAPALFEALKKIQKPDYGYFFGPLGIAASGSSVVWYGVHTFEMMVKAMGRGALSCKTVKHTNGVVITVEYPDKKSAVADMQEGCFSYGGVLRVKKGEPVHYVVDADRLNTDLVRELHNFLKGGLSPVPLEDTLHVMALLDASERSLQSGNTEKVPQ